MIDVFKKFVIYSFGEGLGNFFLSGLSIFVAIYHHLYGFSTLEGNVLFLYILALMCTAMHVVPFHYSLDEEHQERLDFICSTKK